MRYDICGGFGSCLKVWRASVRLETGQGGAVAGWRNSEGAGNVILGMLFQTAEGFI